MRAEGSLEVPAARPGLYRMLSDPRRLEDALPSVDAVVLEDDEHFAVMAAPATGLGVTPLALSVVIADRREDEHVRLAGTGEGGEYTVSFAVEVDFHDAGPGTRVDWVAEARFSGVIGSLGQRVLPAILRQQVERVVRAAGTALDAQPASA